MRWLITADARWVRGNISDGNTILEIKLDWSSTAPGDRVITSANNVQGNRPAISQIPKLVSPYSGPGFIFKITENIK